MSADRPSNVAGMTFAGLCLVTLIVHQRRTLPLIPTSESGKAQLLYLVFLWWIVAGNFERALVAFAPQRLVTEGVIHLNAVMCSLLILLCVPVPMAAPATGPALPNRLLPQIAAFGLAGLILCVGADWAIVRAVWGNQFAGQASMHIRFGPNATATKEKPAPDKPHP